MARQASVTVELSIGSMSGKKVLPGVSIEFGHGIGVDLDVDLGHESVSAHHATLRWAGVELFVIPHPEATTPTTIGGAAISAPVRLGIGDAFQCAQVTVKVIAVTLPDPPAPPIAVESPPPFQWNIPASPSQISALPTPVAPDPPAPLASDLLVDAAAAPVPPVASQVAPAIAPAAPLPVQTAAAVVVPPTRPSPAPAPGAAYDPLAAAAAQMAPAAPGAAYDPLAAAAAQMAPAAPGAAYDPLAAAAAQMAPAAPAARPASRAPAQPPRAPATTGGKLLPVAALIAAVFIAGVWFTRSSDRPEAHEGGPLCDRSVRVPVRPERCVGPAECQQMAAAHATAVRLRARTDPFPFSALRENLIRVRSAQSLLVDAPDDEIAVELDSLDQLLTARFQRRCSELLATWRGAAEQSRRGEQALACKRFLVEFPDEIDPRHQFATTCADPDR